TQPSFIHGGELKKYQIDGLNWLIYKWHKQTPSILADDMGLGKTVQIVSMLACLHHEYRRFPFVIAAPSSTLGHWKAEFAKWAPELVLVHYTGDGKGREKLREMMIFGPDDEDRDPGKNVRFHVLLANYESLMRDSAFFKKIDFEVLICDEGHRLKNDAAKTFSAFRKNIRNKHRIILTGTPLQNNVRELFNLLGFLDPKKFKNPAEWEKQYDSDELTDEKVKEIHELLAPYFLRRTKDAADLGLPPKVEILLPVSLTSLQTELYKGVLAKNAQILKQIGISTSGRDNARVSSLQNVLMELRKICNHPYCLQDVEPEGLSTEETLKHMIAASGKLALLHKMLAKLNAQGHRILIFSQFKMNLDILDDYLIGAGYSFVRMDGETALNIRQSIIDRFNDRNQDCFIFLLTTRTGAEGINLTAADTIIIYDADWNPHRDLQAMARAHRIGQDKPLVVYRFFTRRCVEEKILEAGKKKLVLDHLIIEQMAKKDSSPEELSSIIRYGAKALFEEDEQAIDAQQVKYDDVEVDRLLDRSAIFAEKQKDAEDPALNTATAKLGTFAKLWINEKADAGADVDLADDGGVGATGENGAVEEDDAGAFWERLLAYNTGKASGIPQQEFHPNGRAKRKRRHVDY
ncbi:SNF2 family N-terminal domain-containing protein, partial [Fimicolochytrium jonesii]|uniref:SNF2 family N-terminal domain-containing protein n=1 Tax=Fimicolochytrium jonesii TaxID=1396493 RepID=UPI0022FE4F48